jgi:small subunit ribosomal protein S16
MVAIRLRRAGSKKRPFFRIVVADSRAARDSSFVEILGYYNPRTKPAIVKVSSERVEYWLSKGAQPSDTVRTLIKRHLTPEPVAAQPPIAGAASAAVQPAAPAAAPPAAAAAPPPAAPAESPQTEASPADQAGTAAVDAGGDTGADH